MGQVGEGIVGGAVRTPLSRFPAKLPPLGPRLSKNKLTRLPLVEVEERLYVPNEVKGEFVSDESWLDDEKLARWDTEGEEL